MAASGRRGTHTLERRIAPGASYNSGRTYDDPKCQPRTRNSIITMIRNWLNDDRRDCGMLWIYGPGGLGKSAVVGLNTEKHFMATITHQISVSVPDPRRYIAQAYEALGDKRGPKRWARLIVIDGLDECQGANVQRYIVRILSTALIHLKVPLFILVSSRPEPPIRDSYNSYDLRDIIYTIVLDEHYLPDSAIKRYFWTKFDQINQTHPLRTTYIPQTWPSTQTIQHLFQRAYASTVIKYVDSAQHRPVERLDSVLRIANPMGDIPFAELDSRVKSFKVGGFFAVTLPRPTNTVELEGGGGGSGWA
ncbi:hypothetical protein CVT26_006804 [Gymnopilus dilepis]|uniref:Nephrocystin 3-like N-terminal domain-containing protein n=1 Tax=Gymnopilus dilepis TaxID=231916 RepID=A0A409Y340_9AGAR|nr:hypothetical protein CVT26_006804 [Gymnopilus dilepis]